MQRGIGLLDFDLPARVFSHRQYPSQVTKVNGLLFDRKSMME
jgi:hypothetical protein